jgi:membrane protein
MSLNIRRPVAQWVLTAAGTWIVAHALVEAALQARELRRQKSGTQSKARDFALTGAEAPPPQPSNIDQSWKRVLIRVYETIGRNRILSVSAGITFYGLLAIFPAVAAFLAVYGFFADVGTVQSHLAALAGGAWILDYFVER